MFGNAVAVLKGEPTALAAGFTVLTSTPSIPAASDWVYPHRLVANATKARSCVREPAETDALPKQIREATTAVAYELLPSLRDLNNVTIDDPTACAVGQLLPSLRDSFRDVGKDNGYRRRLIQTQFAGC